MKKPNILLVDDRQENLLALEVTLKDFDANLLKVTSGEEALKHSVREEIALILLDVQMPGMNGFQTAKLLRDTKATQTIPIIFITAINKDQPNVLKGYEVGAIDYLFKPINSLILKSKVQLLLEFYQQKQQLEEQTKDLQEAKQNLENTIQERTSALLVSNEQLHLEITEHKKTEEALQIEKAKAEAASVAKTEFLANMSHEIRTPLNAILGFSEIILKRAEQSNLPEDAQQYLKNIQNSGKTLTELINNILDLSKIEAGKMTLSEEDFELGSLVEGVFQVNSVQALQKNLQFSYEIDPQLPRTIHGDRTKLNQILMNLISNAIKFTPDNKSVHLKVMRKQATIVFKVADQGIGIDAAQQKTIFEAFEQAEKSTTRQFGGTGLGLAITKKMTQLLGGQIELQSAPRQGSVFTVTLPLIEPLKLTTEQNVASSQQLKFMADNIILLVEDNLMNQEMTKALLEDLGLQVCLANNGKEGLIKTRELMTTGHLPDLILMDLHMPKMDGVQASSQIRQLPGCHQIPIIILSADAFQEQKKEAFATGVSEYLTKPLELEKLLPLLKKYLRMQDTILDASSTTNLSGFNSIQEEVLLDRTILSKFQPTTRMRLNQMFLEQTSACVETMNRLAKNGETFEMSEFAHLMKGCSLGIGACQLAKICEKLQRKGKQKDLSDIDTLLTQLEQCYRNTTEAVKALSD